MHRPGSIVAVALGAWALVALAGTTGAAGGGRAAPSREEVDVVHDADELALRLGGVGGVYLLAEPGELWIEVEKRDRNERQRHTELRALLLGPDRRLLQEATLPDDGKPAGSGLGPPQRVRLVTEVRRPGIYALNVTVSQDRYGEDVLWGFRTSCRRYLIETSRGHRDARHLEPLLLANPEVAGDICFAPRRGPLAIEVEGLPPGVASVAVHDSRGELLRSLPVDAGGRAAHTFDAEVPRRHAPWRLHLPACQATVHVDGVTRWDGTDAYPNLSLWTDRAEAWFALAPHRWMLTPYSRTVYVEAGTAARAEFQVRNGSPDPQVYRLSIEADEEVPARLSTKRVALDPGATVPVAIEMPAGADGTVRAVHLRITPQADPEVSTWSTLTVHAGQAPASRPLELPLVLRPYAHENEQFGYLPDYPVGTEVYFDPENRPVVWTGTGLATRRDGEWTTTVPSAAAAADAPLPAGLSMACTKVAFDADGGWYAIARAAGRGYLLYSSDGGRTFAAHDLGEAGRSASYDIEQLCGPNRPSGPPPVLRSVEVAADDSNLWRRICTLDLFLPEIRSGRLEVGAPLRLSDSSLGVGSHSGVPSAVVSRGDRVHVIWAEPTDPQDQVPGVPTCVVTCDRASRSVGEPMLIGYGAPPNDVHNRPSIAIDGRGFLHAMAGTHGQPFQYARSLRPNEAAAGWTDPVPVGDRQTYIGLVCGPDDVLHLVYRFWRHNVEPFPVSHHATLAYQRQRPGQPWEAPRVLVVAPFSEYGIFYHRLTIDRRGRLFLNYDYWSTYWFYRNDHFGRRRALMMSADGGNTWKLVESRDFD